MSSQSKEEILKNLPSITILKHQFFGAQPILSVTSTHNYWKNYSFDYIDICWQSEVSAFSYLV